MSIKHGLFINMLPSFTVLFCFRFLFCLQHSFIFFKLWEQTSTLYTFFKSLEWYTLPLNPIATFRAQHILFCRFCKRFHQIFHKWNHIDFSKCTSSTTLKASNIVYKNRKLPNLLWGGAAMHSCSKNDIFKFRLDDHFLLGPHLPHVKIGDFTLIVLRWNRILD